MNADAAVWLDYARENLAVAEWCMQSGLANPCLQNAQQTVEKSLKALRIHAQLPERRTHAVLVLRQELLAVGVNPALSQEDCELLDSIYVDSKYPTTAVIPHGPPDQALCKRCVGMARNVVRQAQMILEKS